MALAINAEGIFKTFRSGWRGKREKEVLNLILEMVIFRAVLHHTRRTGVLIKLSE